MSRQPRLILQSFRWTPWQSQLTAWKITLTKKNPETFIFCALRTFPPSASSLLTAGFSAAQLKPHYFRPQYVLMKHPHLGFLMCSRVWVHEAISRAWVCVNMRSHSGYSCIQNPVPCSLSLPASPHSILSSSIHSTSIHFSLICCHECCTVLYCQSARLNLASFITGSVYCCSDTFITTRQWSTVTLKVMTSVPLSFLNLSGQLIKGIVLHFRNTLISCLGES